MINNNKTLFAICRFGMVYYNNVISAALLLPFCIMNGEFNSLFDPQIMTKEFIFWNCVAGFLGFYLNFASLWCVGATSATTYAIVGKLIVHLLLVTFLCLYYSVKFLL
jgi:GDP-mannose transporter